MNRTKYQKTIFKNNNHYQPHDLNLQADGSTLIWLGLTWSLELYQQTNALKEIYMCEQEELVRRRVVKTSANGQKRSYSSNYCFSQIVICGNFGEMFRRIHWNNAVANLYYGAALAGLKLPDLNAMPEQSMNLTYRK